MFVSRPWLWFSNQWNAVIPSSSQRCTIPSYIVRCSKEIRQANRTSSSYVVWTLRTRFDKTALILFMAWSIAPFRKQWQNYWTYILFNKAQHQWKPGSECDVQFYSKMEHALYFILKLNMRHFYSKMEHQDLSLDCELKIAVAELWCDLPSL